MTMAQTDDADARSSLADAIVGVRSLWFSYPGPPGDRFELRAEDLRIARGERVALIGPSGSGKTTFLNLIAGILRPSRGTVALDGSPVHDMSDARRRALRIARIGMVFQEFELLEYLSAFENILLPLRISRHMRVTRAARERARALARALAVEHTLSRLPARLSQGERQRVAICRALIASPSLIMGDEPTGNLDPRTADRTLDLLFEQARAHHAALLIVTHNHAILDRFDRVIDIRELHAPTRDQPGARHEGLRP